MADTRKDKRAPVSLKVRFKSATVDEFIEQYAHDISRGGVFIKSKQPMPVGTLLKFEVQLKDESPLIHGVGRVVWKREAGAGATDEAPAGMGIKFIRMDPECRTVVDRIVNQRGGEAGQYESGVGDEERPAIAAPAAAAAAPPPTTPSAGPTAAASKSRHKETIPFFPAVGPTEAELPRPEDRTQVRHASEFLASALAEAGSDESAREAERKAAEARKRSEEIERERAAQRQRELDAEREKAAAEREKVEASERARSEPPKRSDRPAPGSDRPVSATAATEIAPQQPQPTKKKSVPPRDEEPVRPGASADRNAPLDAEIVPRSRRNEKRASSAPPSSRPGEKRSPLVVRTVSNRGVSEPPPPLPQSSSSYALPVAAAVVAVLGVGAYMWANSGSSTETDAEGTLAAATTDTATPPVEAETEREPDLGTTAVGATDLGTPVEPDPTGEVAGEPAEEPGEVEPAGAVATTTTPTTTPTTPTTPTPTTPTTPTPSEATVAAAGATPTEAPVAHFRIDSTPPGATILVGGSERGTAPVEVDLPVGEQTTLAARLAGYREATQTVTPTRTQRPVRMTLQSLPYFVEVTTTPPGARVRAGGQSATTSEGSPSRIAISTPPRTAVQVVGTLSGYTDATQSVPANQFRERNGEMVATVSLTLAERPAAPATPRPPRRPREPAAAGESGASGGASAEGGGESGAPAEPTPPPRRPDPPPAEEEEAPPDNPF
jgi:uncharacterized protein (TIGR02266 family)